MFQHSWSILKAGLKAEHGIRKATNQMALVSTVRVVVLFSSLNRPPCVKQKFGRKNVFEENLRFPKMR